MKSGAEDPYDVIVCGAGHAGCEAALAAARMGAETLMLTGNIDTVAQMSCNPAVGGQAKGHMVREIDALGGAMAVNADTTGIQFRLLNTSKGPAVQAPRVQCDKKAYQFRMKHTLELESRLTLFQAMVTGLVVSNDRVVGVETNLGVEFRGVAVVVTTGTFLRALTYVGQERGEGGRMADFAAKGLSGSLMRLGVELERLKTGTPPRILGTSMDRSVMNEQKGDENPTFFGFYDTRGGDELELFHVEQAGQRRLGWKPGRDQVSCWMTHTGAETAAIVRNNLNLSALYSGAIVGVGPRYCPSIEDKVVRFAEKERHLLFLEPEGRNTDEWYINGLSTSLPVPIQIDILQSIKGLQNAQLLRPAYAVEYDFAPPTQLRASLESKVVEGLFFAGQINGTSGYEEAAAQGLVAGINAVRKQRGEGPLVIGREEAYIGVLIDDLVTKGTREPYRMFTSRAEFRLLLNHGSAEIRLAEHSARDNLVPVERQRRIAGKAESVNRWVERLESERGPGGSWGDFLRRRGDPGKLPREFRVLSEAAAGEVLYRVRYQGYLKRELKQIEKRRNLERIMIPNSFDYQSVNGLRREGSEKLKEIRPMNLAQASRISGVSPADISILMVKLGAALGGVGTLRRR